jgi:hypothetical protein
MHRIGAGDFRCRDDRGDVEVAAQRVSRTDADRLVSQPSVQRVGIDLAMNRDGP